MGLKLEVGKTYRTIKGQKVGPMKKYGEDMFDLGVGMQGLWSEDGSCQWGENNSIIALWQDTPTGPVRTVTRTTREIVPGVYDGLDVGQAVDGHVFIAMGIHRVDAEAIDALIAHLTVIRDALEDV